MIKSEVVVAVRKWIREFYPHFTSRDIDRVFEILEKIPRDDYRREDLLVAIDQAYSENHAEPRHLTRKDFMQ